MTNWSTLIISLLIGSGLGAQEKVTDVDCYLYTHVYKNIAAYNIRYCSHQLNGAIKENIFRDNADFFYEPFIAGPGFKLDMKIEKMDSCLPDSSFILYKIFVGGFDYTNKSDTMTIRYFGRHTLQNFLVGLNQKNGQIKFISGQFFLSALAEEFNVNVKKPESVISYLQWRTYFVGGRNISFWKKQRKKLLFKAVSDILNRQFVVSVDIKNPDYIEMIL
jgi:hypothetical protein